MLTNLAFWNHQFRCRLLTLGVILVAGGMIGPGRALAQTDGAGTLRIGIVTPTRTGTLAIDAALYDLVGEAARMGALLAAEVVGNRAESLGIRLDILPASSPTAEAAFRAGQRLVETEKVDAIIGGLGEGQAEALNKVATEHNIPFFNIGSTRDALRGCGRYMFHVEASAAMYLDALVAWYTSEDRRRWFVINEDSDEGGALRRRALRAIAQHSSGGKVVGTAAVAPEQPVYMAELDAANKAAADVVLLLLDVRDQMVFLAQTEDMGTDAMIAPFPDPVTQTRDYFGATSYRAPSVGSGYRTVLWETTLDANGAGELNERFISRWGEPMDPTAWAAYQAVSLLFDAVAATGTLDGSLLVQYLESPEAAFDAQKGVDVSFRPWDHQLRQPLYVVKIDPGAEWGIRASQRVGLAELVGEIPQAGQPLDQLGDGIDETKCQP